MFMFCPICMRQCETHTSPGRRSYPSIKSLSSFNRMSSQRCERPACRYPLGV